MSAFPRLRELQTLCWRLITAPEGVAAGASALHRSGELDDTDLDFLVRGDARLDATGRLDVYADMYFYRLRDCLAEDYPKLAERIGPERFHNLVTDYLLAHPSRHFSLRELGRALPGFLARHALARDFPEAADLALLEWARVDVFDERDAEPLDRPTLLACAGADASFRFGLAPAARLLRLRREVLARWRDPASEGPEAPAPVDVVVWRRDFGVHHRSLDDDEARCLAALAAAPCALAALGEVLVEALPADPDPERAGERLAALLDAWCRDALLVASLPD